MFQNGFASNGLFITMVNSSYKALEVSLRHSRQRAPILTSYTYAKSMDNAFSGGPGNGDQGAGEQVNPLNPRLSRALSAFDMTHNFVVRYSYELPVDKVLRANRLTRGWTITDLTRYTTGLPVTMTEHDDTLLGKFCTGPTCAVVDTPNYTVRPTKLNQSGFGRALFQHFAVQSASARTTRKLPPAFLSRPRFATGISV